MGGMVRPDSLVSMMQVSQVGSWICTRGEVTSPKEVTVLLERGPATRKEQSAKGNMT